MSLSELSAIVYNSKFDHVRHFVFSSDFCKRVTNKDFESIMGEYFMAIHLYTSDAVRRRDFGCYLYMIIMSLYTISLDPATTLGLDANMRHSLHVYLNTIAKCLESEYVNAVERPMCASKETIEAPLIIGARPKKIQGRPPNRTLPHGHSYIKLVHDACLMHEQVNMWIDVFIETERRHSFSIEKRNYNNSHIDPSSAPSHTIGCMFFFHLLTHRMLDRDENGSLLYETPPVMGRVGGLLSKFKVDLNSEKCDLDPLFRDANDTYIWVDKSLSVKNSDVSVYTTKTLDQMIRNIQRESDYKRHINVRAQSGGDQSKEMTLYLVAHELLVMNKLKRFWHLNATRNWIRQLYHRATQRHARMAYPTFGANFLERCMEILDNNSIKELHKHGHEEINQEELKREIVQTCQKIKTLMDRNEQKSERKLKLNAEMREYAGNASDHKSKKCKTSPDGDQIQLQKQSIQGRSLNALEVMGIQSLITQNIRLFPKVFIEENKYSFSELENVLGHNNMRVEIENVLYNEEHKKYFLIQLQDLLRDIYTDSSDPLLKPCANLVEDYYSGNKQPLLNAIQYTVQSIQRSNDITQQYSDDFTAETVQESMVKDVNEHLESVWESWKDVYLLAHIVEE